MREDENWKTYSIEQFCEFQLLPDIKNYKSGTYLVYDQIKNLRTNTVGIVLTRKCGCEFWSQETSDPEFEAFDHWKGEAVSFYYIRRVDEDTFFGRHPSVQWQKVDLERAERLVGLMKHHFKAKFYTGSTIRYLLEYPIGPASIDTKPASDVELENLWETAWAGLVKEIDLNMSEDQLNKLFVRCLDQAALEAGLKYHEGGISEQTKA